MANFYDGTFLQKSLTIKSGSRFLQKSVIMEVWQGPKYDDLRGTETLATTLEDTDGDFIVTLKGLPKSTYSLRKYWYEKIEQFN